MTATDFVREDTQLDPDNVLAAVGQAVAEAREATSLPGVAIGVVNAAGIQQCESYGETNVAHALPVTSTTIFQAGSVSKLFTTMAAMRMVESGQLTLDGTVRTWLPDLKLADESAAAQVTVQNLLQHTGGWNGDYNVDTGRGDGALRRMLDVIAAAPQWTEVGSTFHYSNLGFVLLGHLMATVAGKSFEDVVDELVIQPLGLSKTGFFLEDLVFERMAAGHLFGDGKVIVSDFARPRSRGPNGGILSSAEDLLNFAHFHLGDGTTSNGTRLLAESTMQEMMSPLWPVRVTGDGIGYGWMSNQWSDTYVVGHSGGTLGFRSRLTVVPSAGLGLVVLTNGTRGDKVIQAAQQALRKVVVGDERAPLTKVTRRDGIEGTYTGGLELAFNGDDLKLSLGRVTCEVLEVAPDCLEAVGGPAAGLKLDVLRAPDGSVPSVRVGSRLRPRV